MEAYLDKEQPEDEFVKIYGDFHGDSRDINIYPQLPRTVVPLSEAIPLMDAYLDHCTDLDKESDKEQIFFDVYSCRDDFHLFSYNCSGIIWQHCKENRPKNREQVWYVGVSEGEEPQKVLFGDRVYAEWADREMERDLAEFRKDKRSQKVFGVTQENLKWKNFRFDVYQDENRGRYLYSYKDGKRYIRPLTEEEVKRKEWCEDNCKPVLLKMMNGDCNPPKVHAEYIINEKRAALSICLHMEEVKRAKEKEVAFGTEFYPEKIFFETCDIETEEHRRTYRIAGDRIEEVDE